MDLLEWEDLHTQTWKEQLQEELLSPLVLLPAGPVAGRALHTPLSIIPVPISEALKLSLLYNTPEMTSSYSPDLLMKLGPGGCSSHTPLVGLRRSAFGW